MSKRVLQGYLSLVYIGMSKIIKKIKTESQEQKVLVNKLRWLHPNLVFFAIPNGGKRGKAEARHMVLEGVQKGTPDIFIAEPKNGYFGLFIELKRVSGSKTSDEQLNMISNLLERGYDAAICHGAQEAYEKIISYLE